MMTIFLEVVLTKEDLEVIDFIRKPKCKKSQDND